MRFRCRLGIHDWTKWKVEERRYDVTYTGRLYPDSIRGKTFPETLRFQVRTCQQCGRHQEEEIK